MEKETRKQEGGAAGLGAASGETGGAGATGRVEPLAATLERRAREREVMMHEGAHGTGFPEAAQGEEEHAPEREGRGRRGRGRGERVVERDPVETKARLRFEIPDEVIERLASRDRTAFRRLTPVKGPRVESLDPVVQRALEETVRKYRRPGAEAREILSSRWLNDAEAVTSNLNKRALPPTTRMLLSQDGVYEVLLLKAIEDGVGREDVEDAPHEHHEHHAPGRGRDPRQSAK